VAGSEFTLQQPADAVVIGGGILGASTAHFLAKKGFGQIVLLDYQTPAAFAASCVQKDGA
jgi:glycine/D-amino acid oxidase-like deaminating enzyme